MLLSQVALQGQVGAGSPISRWTGFVCALGDVERLAAGFTWDGNCTVVAWERQGHVATCCPLLSLCSVPSQGFELWKCLPARTRRGVKGCQGEAKKGKRGSSAAGGSVSQEAACWSVSAEAVQFGGAGKRSQAPCSAIPGLVACCPLGGCQPGGS